MGLFKKNKSIKTDKQSDAKVTETSTNSVTITKEKTRRSKKSKNSSSEISTIAKKYNIRISAPHGYYPEDVDKVLNDLDKQLTLLSKENSTADIRIANLTKERDSLKTELTKLKLQISTMEFPDASTETDFHMLGRMSTINPAVGTLEAEVLQDDPERRTTNKIEPVVEDYKYESNKEEEITPSNDKDSQDVFDDLISKTNRQRTIIKPPPKLEQIPQVKSDESINKIDEVIQNNLMEEIPNDVPVYNRHNNRKKKFDLEILGGNEDAE